MIAFDPYARVVASLGSCNRIQPSASPETKYVWDAVKCKWVRMEGTEDLRSTDPVWVFNKINSEAAVATAMVDAFDALFEKLVI